MANYQNFSSLLLDNIDNGMLITSELMTPSKDATDTTGRPTLSKSITSWYSGKVRISFRTTSVNSTCKKVELRNKDDYIKD